MDAPVGLLDTCASERHEVGARIIDWSRAQVAIVRPARIERDRVARREFGHSGIDAACRRIGQDNVLTAG